MREKGGAMYGEHLLACGTLWARFGDVQAGRELVRAMDSTDESVRILARILLQQADHASKELIAEALAQGEIAVGTANLFGFEPDEKWEIESLAPRASAAELA